MVRSGAIRDVRNHCESSVFILIDVLTTRKRANAFDQVLLEIATCRGDCLISICLPFYCPLLFLNDAVVQIVGEGVEDVDSVRDMKSNDYASVRGRYY